jgi:hypothetical protein
MHSGTATSRWMAYGAIAAGGAGAALALAGIDTPLRGPLVLLVLAGTPAAVAASWLTSLDIFARIIVASAVAITLNALVAEAMVALGAWSPRTGLVALLLICAVGSALRLKSVRDLLHLLPAGPVRRTAPNGEFADR